MTQNHTIHKAIEREMGLAKYLISGYAAKIKQFEKTYKIKTTDFIRLFEEGKMGDEQDFFEWVSLVEAKKLWMEKLSDLHVA